MRSRIHYAHNGPLVPQWLHIKRRSVALAAGCCCNGPVVDLERTLDASMILAAQGRRLTAPHAHNRSPFVEEEIVMETLNSSGARRIVHRWVASIGLDDTACGTHTMRRTKASLIYRRTKNLRAVQLLLGHTKLESIVRYLGIEVDDVLEMAEQTGV